MGGVLDLDAALAFLVLVFLALYLVLHVLAHDPAHEDKLARVVEVVLDLDILGMMAGSLGKKDMMGSLDSLGTKDMMGSLDSLDTKAESEQGTMELYR